MEAENQVRTREEPHVGTLAGQGAPEVRGQGVDRVAKVRDRRKGGAEKRTSKGGGEANRDMDKERETGSERDSQGETRKRLHRKNKH